MDLLMYALMRSGSIEVGHIRVEHTVELLLMKDQQVVKAFTPHASQKAYADRIRSCCIIRCFEDLHVARCCYTGETRSELVVIISNKAVFLEPTNYRYRRCSKSFTCCSYCPLKSSSWICLQYVCTRLT